MRIFSFVVVLTLFSVYPLKAQYTVSVEPATLSLEVGEKAQLRAEVFDAQGNLVDAPLRFFSRARQYVAVDRATGEVTALQPGTHVIVASFRDGAQRYNGEVTVEVAFPSIDRIEIVGVPERMYAGSQLAGKVKVIDAAGHVRDDVALTISTQNPEVASMDRYYHVTALSPGQTRLEVEGDGVRTAFNLEVVPNPIARIEMNSTAAEARTGDVIVFEAIARDAAGNKVEDAPIQYAVLSRPDDFRGPSASSQIDQDGRFVAEMPGLYTVIASTGTQSAQQTVSITQRDVSQRVEVVGHSTVSDVYTSDIWVWEGVDGRDYAVTGTWSANGEAYFWDVTDPASPVILDTVTVDARTVNDVKVNEAGDVCVITREGASNRRNGLVILDCTDPSNVEILAAYDDELTGGVHNVFIYENHIYAVNNGQRYDIINIDDPSNPHRVGRFELDTPGHAIHDVWVVDGIAYSSNWSDGVWMVDVGNGIKGGSTSNPVAIGHYAYPSGWNHAAFPYYNEETGKFYIIAGDEAFPYGRPYEKAPEEAAGWIHFLDFTDPENPKEVARYEVPEAGTHNFWVDGDKLYIGYYDGGLRIVDISGDLMGDLYKQGREIARFLSYDLDGHIPNATMVWGPQPHKGHIFFSDHYNGLWSVKLIEPEKEAEPGI